MGCSRMFCPHCNEEMIHRDNRKSYEASSAFNQIVHREGPREITAGDIDSYFLKYLGNEACLRLIEHKQPLQPLKKMQLKALQLLDLCIRYAADNSLFGMAPGSGVFLVRGPLKGGEEGRRKVDFAAPQKVETLDGQEVIAPKRREYLWDWLCCDTPWTRRNEKW